MKRTIYIFLTVGMIFFAACTKGPGVTPPPPAVKYNVTAQISPSDFGTGSLSSSTITAEQTSTLTLKLQKGKRVSAISITGAQEIFNSSNNTITVMNPFNTINLNVSLTDSLKRSVLDSVATLVAQNKWNTVKLEKKKPNDASWTTVKIDPCQADDFDLYTKTGVGNGTVISNQNGTSCSNIGQQQYNPQIWRIRPTDATILEYTSNGVTIPVKITFNNGNFITEDVAAESDGNLYRITNVAVK